MTLRDTRLHTLCLVFALALGWAPSVAAQEAPSPPPGDLTGNGRMDGNDAATVRDAWNALQDTGRCTAPGLESNDVDGDGCITVADVQLIAAQIGGAQAGAAPASPQALESMTFTVTSALSDNDDNPGDGICRTAASSPAAGACTLRAALQEANARPGPDRIEFDIRNPDGSCPDVVNIRPGRNVSQFFLIEDDATTIDGYTQCGAKPNTGAVSGNAVIKIQIDGAQGSGNYPANDGVDGLTIRSSHNVIRGLSIFRWDHQILITGSNANYNQIQGNFLGTSADGQFRYTSGTTNHREGIRLWYNTKYNVIGCGSFNGTQFQPCTNPADVYAARNIISGNGDDGVHLQGNSNAGSPEHNRIVGNYIGLKQDGLTPLPNRADAVDFELGAANNWLGGESPLERNVISGNGSEGIEISHSTRTQGNRVVGNYFGLDATGMGIVPNTGSGVSFEDTVNNNYAYKNYTSGNLQSGFRFYLLAYENQVYDNIIGLMADGVTPAGNQHDGVYVMGGSQRNLITRNTIAHNREKGVDVDPFSVPEHNWIAETYYNTISRNRMYNNGEKGINLNSKTSGGITIYGNQRREAPELVAASTTLAIGRSSCAHCVVEIFVADKTSTGGPEPAGEGRDFLGAGETDASGSFAVPISAPEGAILTATVTDREGNTSEFGRNIRVQAGPVQPLPTATPAPTASTTPVPSATPTVEPQPAGDNQVFLPLTVR